MDSETPSTPKTRHAVPGDQTAAARLIDANLNRGSEALRVIEDTLRFVFEDSHLQSVCKGLRHDLGGLSARLSRQIRLMAARNASGDVGRTNENPDEYVRADVAQILHANFSRAGQSLRSLEEYCKLVDGAAAQSAEQIRYGIYELEISVAALKEGRLRLTDVRLCVMIEGCRDEKRFEANVRELIDGGADMIQLREKSLDDRMLLERARQLVDLTRSNSVVAIVNDRVDIAALSQADGVHLGQDDLSPSAARKLGGTELLIGVSTHSLPQAQQAVLDGANYIGVGPVFPSDTKDFEQFGGIPLLEAISAEISLPAFAIGGINAHNLPEVFSAGFWRVAVAGAVLRSDASIRNATSSLAALLVENVSAGGEPQNA